MHKLKSKVVSGSIWLFSFQIFDNILGFIRLLILARLLSPSDFGLVGIAWLVIQILNTFTQTGIVQALVHKQKVDKYLHTAWTYLILRGVVLYSLVFTAAPILGSFFNSISSILIIRVIGLTLLIDGFTNIGTVFFTKDLTFNKQFIIQIAGSLADFIVALTSALLFHNVWALVLGSIGNSVIRLILSYVLTKYRPKLEFNFQLVKELNNYGKWIFGSNILVFLFTQGDDILVGRLLGTTSLGFYQLAYRISNLPTTQITHISSSVLFPAYSKIQQDIKGIGNAYLKVLQLIAFLSFFVSVIIIAFSHEFIVLFLGEKWLPMQYSLQILTIWGLIRSIGATTGPLWQAIGTPSIPTKIQILQVIILILIIYPLTVTWDITGTSVAVVMSALVPNIIAVYIVSKSIQRKLGEIIWELLLPFIGSILVLGTYYLFTNIWLINVNYISFFIKAITMTLIYIVTSVIFSKFYKYTLYSNIFSLIERVPFSEKILKYINKLRHIFT